MPLLSSYRRVLATPGALLFSATGLVARLPISMAGLGIVFLGSVEAIAGCAPAPAPAAPPAPPRPPGYGPLVTDPKKILSLPEGFTYRVVAEAGVSTLSDGGEPTPSDTDGTACFATPIGLTLIDNHEIGSRATRPVAEKSSAPGVARTRR